MDNPLRIREPLTQRHDVLKKRGLIYKYPRTISSIIIFTALTVLYSKPIYDIFFRPKAPFDYSEPSFIRRLNLQQEELRRRSK